MTSVFNEAVRDRWSVASSLVYRYRYRLCFHWM